MKIQLLLPAALIVSHIAASAQALDQVRAAGTGSANGTITAMTANEVSVETRNEGVVKVPVNQIVEINFDADPSKLKLIRSSIRSGRYIDSLEDLKEVEKEVTDKYVKEDIEFLKAYAHAMEALRGSGDPREAGRQMLSFVTSHPNSWHYYESVRLLGDLLMKVENYDVAQAQYDKLAQAPWADYQMQAAVLKGRAYRGAGKPDQAKQQFQKALSLAEGQSGESIEAMKLAATLGSAECTADAGDVDAAIGQVQEVIKTAHPENTEIHARAYTTLGNCLKKKGDAKEALLAFLHVDLLYFTEPQVHAEALSNLVDLYQQVGNANGALRARERLESRYPGAGN